MPSTAAGSGYAGLRAAGPAHRVFHVVQLLGRCADGAGQRPDPAALVRHRPPGAAGPDAPWLAKGS